MAGADALRCALRESLLELSSIRSVTGNANYLLCHLEDGAPTVSDVLARCRAEGVFLRDVSNMGTALGSRVFRTAVKDAQANVRILASLGRALGANRANAIHDAPSFVGP